MRYESGEKGLNLTHSQDKDYIQVKQLSSVVVKFYSFCRDISK
jgi:hypothetical protein